MVSRQQPILGSPFSCTEVDDDALSCAFPWHLDHWTGTHTICSWNWLLYLRRLQQFRLHCENEQNSRITKIPVSYKVLMTLRSSKYITYLLTIFMSILVGSRSSRQDRQDKTTSINKPSFVTLAVSPQTLSSYWPGIISILSSLSIAQLHHNPCNLQIRLLNNFNIHMNPFQSPW